jgi:uncharacterized protein with gpF-like domain
LKAQASKIWMVIMNRKKTKSLKPVNYNAGNIRWYQKELLRTIREMNDDVKAEIVTIMRDNPLAMDMAMDANPVDLVKRAISSLAKKWIDNFIRKAIPVSDEVADKTLEAVDRGILASARKDSLVINLQWTDAMLQKRDAIIAENVSLIRSIPEKYFTEVESMVFRSIAKGGDRKQLADEIEREFGKRHGITRRRAEFIARDQVRKATSALQTHDSRRQASRKASGFTVVAEISHDISMCRLTAKSSTSIKGCRLATRPVCAAG